MTEQNLSQAIKSLQDKSQKDLHEAKEKEMKLHSSENELQTLKQEIPRLEMELATKKRAMQELNTSIPQLRTDLQKLKLEQVKNSDEITKISKSYQDGLRKRNIGLK